MTDLIDRQAVLALAKDIVVGEYSHRCIDPQLVRELPAVEAEPVRHGRWEDCTNHKSVDFEDKCSVCGYTMFADFLHRFRYCPWCGAKMDG